MEAHGGYLCRIEGFGPLDVVSLAQEALREDGLVPDESGLQVSVIHRRKVVRLAYDTPRVYGRPGAHWYASHHALARRLSEALPVTVHTYVFDPLEREQVLSFGDGRRVGGERLLYEDVESLDDDMSEVSFNALKQKWPLGHLARVFGISREELLGLPRRPSLLLDLSRTVPSSDHLEHLWSTLPGPSSGDGAR